MTASNIRKTFFKNLNSFLILWHGFCKKSYVKILCKEHI